MNYPAAYQDFFANPKWFMNLLLAGVCLLIPVIGPMVVLGWLATGFWGRTDETPSTFPDFDFGKFGIYLQRGLWPLLVALCAIVVLYIVFFIIMIILTIIASIGGKSGIVAILVMLVSLVVELAMFLVSMFVIRPLMLRAIITQDFVKSFDFKFLMKYVGMMWMEILISSIVLLIAGFILGILGMIALCVGIFLAIALQYYAAMHMDKQIYKLYVSKGGEAIPLSPTLSQPA